MTIENTTPATDTAAPADDTLPPELAFLKERGEDITEFLQPAEGDAGKAAETPPAEGDKGKAAEAPKGDDTEPGEVRIGEDGKVRDAKGRFVPLGALHAERGKRQTAESELTRLREQLAVATTKLELASKAPAQQQPAKDAPKNPFDEPDIDPNQDLLGAMQQLRARQVWQREQHTKATTETTAALTEQGVVQVYRDDTMRFAAQQPDYPQAFEHLIRSRAAELIALGVKDQAELARQIKADEQEIVRHAIANGRRPAEVFYGLAIAKGYQQAQQAAPQAQAAPAAAKPAGKTPAEQQIDAINAGQAAGKTLSGAGAGAGAPGLTVEQYLSMSVDEIIALKRTPGGMAQLQAIGAA